MITGMSWRDDAACLDVDPDLFFPVGPAEAALDQIGQAKRICLSCRVREPCLAWSLELGAVSGIWGGVTEDERRVLRGAAARRHDRVSKTAIHE
jgi:WhiB family transcriptional regulator, redox-sensing transcriptional regulator